MSNNYPFNVLPLNQGFPCLTFLPPTCIPPTPIPNMVPQMPGQQWLEYASQEGRFYYYNMFTKQSTWEKPDELKTPTEKILSECPWKEFLSETGKVYYYNSVTKQSVWFKPTELIEAERMAYGTNIQPAIDSTVINPVKIENEVNAIDEAIKATLGSYMEQQENTDNDSNSDNDQKIKLESIAIPHTPTFKTKEEMEEGWRQMFREFNVSGNSTWESALKLVSSDSRYDELKKYNQKKQVFNTYKIQRQKEEREEIRLKMKKAKEDLEGFILMHPKLSSAIGYRKADSLLGSCTEWTSVPEADRREIYDYMLSQMVRREKEEAKILKKRNIKLFEEILNEIPNLTFKTTWYDVQRILLENPKFVGDEDLQSMDKEDALICFEKHIRILERLHDEETERELCKIHRQYRKNREAFNVLLDELREKNKLNSLSLWKDLYSIIRRDERFYKMLSQPGSTPLDLFKFYVLELKMKFSKEKKIVLEILEEQNFAIDIGMTFENFLSIIEENDRGKSLDKGNVKMTFANLLEKAEAADRQRQREEIRLQKRNEEHFRQLLITYNITGSLSWDDVCQKLGDNSDFRAVSSEADRIRLYKEHLLNTKSSIAESKKKRKHQSSSVVSLSSDDGTNEIMSQRKLIDDSSMNSDGCYVSDEETRIELPVSKKTKKKKRKKHHHRRNNRRKSLEEEEEVIVNVNNINQPSDGEIIDDDDEEEEEQGNRRGGKEVEEGFRRRRSFSSGEISENEWQDVVVEEEEEERVFESDRNLLLYRR